VPKLVLKVSESVPELPATVRREKGLTVKRVRRLSAGASSGTDIVAWLLDADFLTRNAPFVEKACLAPGSVLLWNPGGKAGKGAELPGDVVFDEVFSFKNPAYFQRTLRNLFRRLHLEQELARKDELLRAKESENSELLKVGIALSAERDNDKLLNDILRQLRQIASADAGTLYLLEGDEASGQQKLRFKITQNDSNPQDYQEFVLTPSKQMISGYVALTGTVLNIDDAYKIPAEREYKFNPGIDKSTGYHTKSMLTVPMTDHKGEILGVVQLINRKTDREARVRSPEDAERFVVPFSHDIEPVVLSLASQAAVSLENNRLYQEIEKLFEGFVNASVQAIESRDPTTSGHSSRVAVYTESLARAVDRGGIGVYKDTHFTDEHLKEIRYASLLHDFGKVGVRENVLVKAEKLYPDQLKLVLWRFDYMRQAKLHEIVQRRFERLMTVGKDEYLRVKEDLDREEDLFLEKLNRYVDAIKEANVPTVLSAEPSRILDEIYGQKFADEGRKFAHEEPVIEFLSRDEYDKLKIPRGSLDDKERDAINEHVTHSYNFLNTIPWTKEMRNIPGIAYGHHEKLDGEGYPLRISGDKIKVQTRMMTISDIFDALTANDRPYKKAVPPRKALDILNDDVTHKKLDGDLVTVFIESKTWEKKIEPAKR
jgi:HD-GYP domain-containing protein (c-di-GMP phosphodiesterase class II)